MDVENSNKSFILLILSQILSVMNINIIPGTALNQGATGFSILLLVMYVILGIPLAYMESIIGQFTERDFLDVWKIRPCLSYIGYIVFIWQVTALMNNHTLTAFTVHYFLLSFENPIPFYTCGSWSKDDCNIIVRNLTISRDCVRLQNTLAYCDNIYNTFPESQFWRYQVLEYNRSRQYSIAWRVGLASGIVCFLMNFICFKPNKSLKYSLPILIIYPIVGLIIFLMGSLQQKGVVDKYQYAIDMDFMVFSKKFRLSNLILLMVHNLGIGSGIMFNLASSCSFRSTCFSNTVMCVIITSIYTVFATFGMAMMTCPYSYEYGRIAGNLMSMPLSFSFEKIPRMIYEYDSKSFYLFIIFSSQIVLGLCSNVVMFNNILQCLLKRNSTLAKYPGLMCLFGVIILFFITIPFFSYGGVKFMAMNYRKRDILISTFIALLESIVFILWYGLHRFSEDVHFMLGIQPNACIKVAWMLANLLLFYSLFQELLHVITNNYFYILLEMMIFFGVFTLFFILHLLVALYKGKLQEAFALDRTWGPKCEVLQRSRGMFSAHAMTKEYMYRQYHLQAGIVARQKASNVRHFNNNNFL